MKLTLRFLVVFSLISVLAALLSCGTGDHRRLTLSCNERNDLYRVLLENNIICLRYDTPTEAVKMARPGSEVLILALHDCRFIPVRAAKTLLAAGKVAGYDRAVFGLDESSDAGAILYQMPETGWFVSTTKLSQFITARYAPEKVMREMDLNLWDISSKNSVNKCFEKIRKEMVPNMCRWRWLII